MKIFIDTEFYEDGKTIELISIGAVRWLPDRPISYFYAENTEFNWKKVPEDHWIQENVRPLLGGFSRPKDEIKDRFYDFVTVRNTSVPEFWGWYADYDWVVIAQLFGVMVDLPPTFPRFCMDLKQEVILKQQRGESFTLPPKPDNIHNALEDARWNFNVYKKLFLESVVTRCPYDAGKRPYWMGVDQYDPCQCHLVFGHNDKCECQHINEHNRKDCSVCLAQGEAICL